MVKEKKLVDQSDISNLIKYSDVMTKLATLATKAQLKAEKDKIVKLQTFDLSYSVVKGHFEDDGTQNCFVHQPVYRCFKKIGNNKRISAWKPKGLSDESIKPHATSNNSYSPTLHYINTKIRVKFDGSCIKQDKLAFNYKTVVNIYIVYEINNLWPFKQSADFRFAWSF